MNPLLSQVQFVRVVEDGSAKSSVQIPSSILGEVATADIGRKLKKKRQTTTIHMTCCNLCVARIGSPDINLVRFIFLLLLIYFRFV
jgi:hypothetical protein